MLETILQAPFMRLLVAFSIGIALRLSISIPIPIAVLLFIITFGIAIGLTTLNKISGNYRFRWIYGFNLHLFFLAFGILITQQKLFSFDNGLKIKGTAMELIGTVSEPPEYRTNSVRCYFDITQVKENKHFKNVKEKVLLYFHKDTNSIHILAGDILLVNSMPGEVDYSGNPYEFNFRRYLAFKGIRYTAYLDNSDWKILAHKNLPVLMQWADELRQKLLGIFSSIGMHGDELAVASSLVIGDQSGLENEIKRAYTTSGTMHILAVSGMHVALIYEILIILLVFLDRVKYGKMLKLVIILLIIWAYSLITGLPASVLRASVMFTFITMGQLTNRPANIFNSLACSAFFLLLINPGNLADVGFQLSYLAVFSIIVFYPLIYHLFYVKNFILNQVWAITAVTLAAQIGTTPISLFYFHQFPNLFLLSNLVIIPLSTVIIYFSIILIVFSGWHWAALILGKVFTFLVWLLNKTVITIEKIPGAVTKGIYLSEFQVILLYTFVFLAVFYVLRKRPVYIILSLSIVFILTGINLLVNLKASTTKEFIVYNERNNLIIQFRNGNQSVWLVEKSNDRIAYFIEKSKYAMNCPENKVVQMDSVFEQSKNVGIWVNNSVWIHHNFLQFQGKRFAIIDDIALSKTESNAIPLDYLFLRCAIKNKNYDFLKWYHPQTIVLGSAISKYKARSFGKELANKSLNVYSTCIAGALKITL